MSDPMSPEEFERLADLLDDCHPVTHATVAEATKAIRELAAWKRTAMAASRSWDAEVCEVVRLREDPVAELGRPWPAIVRDRLVRFYEIRDQLGGLRTAIDGARAAVHGDHPNPLE